MPKVWVVRADGGELTEKFVDGGYASIGWEMGDLSQAADIEEIEALYRKHHPKEKSKERIRTNVGQIHRFLKELRSGDFVLTPARASGTLHYGTVSDDVPYFVEAEQVGGHNHPNRRSVAWQKETLQRGEFSVPFQRSLTAWLTVFSIDKHRAEFFPRLGVKTFCPRPIQSHNVNLTHTSWSSTGYCCSIRMTLRTLLADCSRR